MNLDIHLDRCDTLLCTGYLEIHIAKEIFQSLDIRQNDVIIIRLTGNQTTGNTCNCRLDRYTCCHQGHAGCTDTCLRSGTIGFKGLRYRTDCIWELFLTWQNRYQCTLSQRSMSDLTASRSSGRFRLTYGVAWEVIMMHISLGNRILIQSVQALCLGKRSKCADVADLCLSSGKHGRTMHTRDQINLRCQRTDLGNGTSIRTFVILQDHLTYGLFLILINSLIQKCKPLFVFRKCLRKLVFDLTDIGFSCLFVIGEYGNFHLFWRYDLANGCKQLFRYRAAFIAVFFFSTFRNDLINKANHLLIDLMCSKNSLNHLIFRNFIGTSLDHNNFLSGGCNRQCQIGYLTLCRSWIEYKLTVNQANLCGSSRTIKRNIRNSGSDGGTKHSSQFRAAIRIHTHNHIVQCNIIAVILRKQWTHRTVNNTCRQNRIFRSLTFSFIKSSRDLSNRIHLFLILNTQREEIDAFSWFLGCGSGR